MPFWAHSDNSTSDRSTTVGVQQKTLTILLPSHRTSNNKASDVTEQNEIITDKLKERIARNNYITNSLEVYQTKNIRMHDHSSKGVSSYKIIAKLYTVFD